LKPFHADFAKATKLLRKPEDLKQRVSFVWEVVQKTGFGIK
jgi:hypothetical protein